jgi:hypothetical protein
MFQLLREMGILLWPEHHIYVAVSATDGTFIIEKNVWTGYGMINSTDTCRHPTVHSKKFGRFGLPFKWSHIVGHDIQSSDVHSCIDYSGECWMETATVVLCKLKLILGVYCVGVRWLLAHLVHIFLCLSYSFLLMAVLWLSYPSRCFSSFTTADSGNILKFTLRRDFP